MYLQADLKFQELLTRCSKYLGWITILISTLILVDWQLDIDILKKPVSDLAAMNPIAALLFLGSAVSFFFLTMANQGKPVILIGKLFAIIVFSFGVFSLVSTLSKPGFSWDHFIYYAVAGKEALHQLPGNIAPLASGCFILTGVSILFLNNKIGNRLPSQYIALFIHLVAAFSIVSHLYHIRSLHGNRFYNPMTLYTAICFLFISLAILFAKPSEGVMKQFTSIHAGSSSARVLVPTAVLIPFGFGLLLHFGSWFRLYSAEFSIVLFVLVIVMIFFIAIWYNTILLNKRDLQKTKTEATLRESQEQIQAIFRSAPDAVIVTNESGRILQWNRQAELLFGWTSQEAWYKHLGDLIIPSKSRQDNMTKLERFIRDGKKNTAEIVLELKGGKKMAARSIFQ